MVKDRNVIQLRQKFKGGTHRYLPGRAVHGFNSGSNR